VSVAGYTPLAYLAVWAPALAAVAVVAVGSGWTGLRAYARRMVAVRGRWYWYVAVAVGVPALYLAAALLTATLAGTSLEVADGWLVAFLVTSAARLTQGPVEELGWRGLALPLFQRRYSGLGAALLVGTVWALWHVPATLVAAAEFARVGTSLSVTLARLFAGLVATSVVVTAVYNGSRGSVPLMVLFHWLTNLAYPWETGATVPLAQDALTVLVAAVVAVAYRRQYLGSAGLATDVIPGMAPDRSGSTGA
jgi:hypothetical protein